MKSVVFTWRRSSLSTSVFSALHRDKKKSYKVEKIQGIKAHEHTLNVQKDKTCRHKNINNTVIYDYG